MYMAYIGGPDVKPIRVFALHKGLQFGVLSGLSSKNHTHKMSSLVPRFNFFTLAQEFKCIY